MLEELESAAGQIAVKVSYEPMAATVGHGGLCRVKGEYRIIIDKRASLRDRVTTLAQSLARFDLSDVKLSKRARKLVDYYDRPSRRIDRRRIDRRRIDRRHIDRRHIEGNPSNPDNSARTAEPETPPQPDMPQPDPAQPDPAPRSGQVPRSGPVPL